MRPVSLEDEEDARAPCSLQTQGRELVRTQGECLQAKTRVLTRNQPCWHPDCELPACKTLRK